METGYYVLYIDLYNVETELSMPVETFQECYSIKLAIQNDLGAYNGSIIIRHT